MVSKNVSDYPWVTLLPILMPRSLVLNAHIDSKFKAPPLAAGLKMLRCKMLFCCHMGRWAALGHGVHEMAVRHSAVALIGLFVILICKKRNGSSVQIGSSD